MMLDDILVTYQYIFFLKFVGLTDETYVTKTSKSG